MRFLTLPFELRYSALTLGGAGRFRLCRAWPAVSGVGAVLCHPRAVVGGAGGGGGSRPDPDAPCHPAELSRSRRTCASFWKASAPRCGSISSRARRTARPFPRDKRAIVYQRAKKELDKRPFGTLYDVYGDDYEWLHHSLAPKPPVPIERMRVTIGQSDGCTQPYSASLLNISAMSYGALSANAVRALNKGAKLGGFAHDTGEGGVSPYHREIGGDLIWEVGSGYFGCRNPDGTFSAGTVCRSGARPADQDGRAEAEPGREAGPWRRAARGQGDGRDRGDPGRADGAGLRLARRAYRRSARRSDCWNSWRGCGELSGGKPAGFKLCIGHPWEFMAICKAMLETGITPDFIVIDGKEGGTGAAPLEFMDHVGHAAARRADLCPQCADRRRACATGCGLAPRARSSAPSTWRASWRWGRTGAMRRADSCSRSAASRRRAAIPGMCPTGVTSPDPLRQRALVVPDKAERVLQLSPQHDPRAGRTGGGGGAGPSGAAWAAPFPAARCGRPGGELCRAIRPAAARRTACRAGNRPSPIRRVLARLAGCQLHDGGAGRGDGRGAETRGGLIGRDRASMPARRFAPGRDATRSGLLRSTGGSCDQRRCGSRRTARRKFHRRTDLSAPAVRRP